MMKLSILKIGLLFVSSLIVNAQDKLYTDKFPLGDVILLDSPFKHARDLNIQALLKYDPDRMLAPYRKAAGLTPKAPNYPNWESDGLDGHIAGHYLTAMAINYASTGNEECLKRLNYMISELKICQDSNSAKYHDWGAGYLGGMPYSNTLWPEIKNGNISAIWKYWVPWYNIHKMYAGLRDAWLYAGNEEAKIMFLKFCDWAVFITSSLSDDQMQSMLNQEHGGMNEVLADAYQIGGDPKYLTAAKRFSHKALLDPMSSGIDNLDNKHANTQIPKFIGFQRIAELSGDKSYHQASSFFWQTVTKNRSLAIGGNSRKEHFPSKKACVDYIKDVDGPESCNSYNMLKLTENLFRVNPSVQYVDFYERTLYNHILSTQHPEHGGYVYFTPARPRHYRVYSAPNLSMWCCVGTGMENHGKYNEFIYTHQSDSLYLNLFIASELNWKEKGIKIRQENNFPYEEQTLLKITKGSAEFKLLVRYPSWVQADGLKIFINGKEEFFKSQPSSYISIHRKWKTGDEIRILLPMQNSIEHLPNVPEYIAFMHGPILLGAKSGTNDLIGLIADDSRWGHIPQGKKLPLNSAPVIINDDIEGISKKLIPVKDSPLTFSMQNINILNPVNTPLEPFYTIHDSRYIMYWMALTNDQYKSYLDSLEMEEKQNLELENRTVDFVAPGEQQPEADHFMQSSNSNTGNFEDRFWRDANNEGFFSYKMETKGDTNLSLMVTYWGYEWGNRKFDIYINDEKLISENNMGRWYESKFQNIEYSIPNELLKNNKFIRVKFQALPDNTAGAVYYVRIVKQQLVK